MNQLEIESIIIPFLQQAITGATKENPKLDFKREWYKLNIPNGLADFLCDTSAMANTVGLDGFIVIGYDEKNNSFCSSPLIHSTLSDSSYFMNIISKHIDPIFTLNTYEFSFRDTTLSVIHIPPSINKPHVIRNYNKNGRSEDQRIFVRKGTQNHRASRYDIDLMYYDRKNIVPEYELQASFHIEGLTTLTYENNERGFRVTTQINVDFENLGRRPVSIVELSFKISQSEEPSQDEILEMTSDRQLKMYPLVVQPNKLKSVIISFESTRLDVHMQNHYKELTLRLVTYKKHIIATPFTAKTSAGKVFSVPLIITGK